MSSLGNLLREAREQKGVSPSEAAEATHIKVQIIDDLEHDSFHRTYAPIYAKGFIRLYGDYLGLNPSLLLDAYEQQKAADAPTPTDRVKQIPKAREAAATAQDPASSLTDGESFRSALLKRIGALASILRQYTDAVRTRLRQRPRPDDRSDLPAVPEPSADAGIPESLEPAGSTTPSDAAAHASRIEPIRDLLRGPYRYAMAAVVVSLLLIILIVIGVLSVRRHSRDRTVADDPGRDFGVSTTAIEFLRPPPPPYYR